MFQSLRSAWKRLSRNQDGNFLTMFALSAPVVMVAAGVAIDYSHGVSEEAKMQAALDSAVLEGAKVEAAQVGTLGTAAAQQAATTAAQNIFAANLSWTGPTPSFTFNSTSMVGTASYAMPTLFSGFTGKSALNLNVASTANIPAATYPICILLMDTAGGPNGGILANGGTNVQGPKCGIATHATGNPAATFDSGGTLNLAQTCVQGTTILQNGGTVNNLKTGCAAPANPFLGTLYKPTPGACVGGFNYGNTESGTLTLNPGTYCGQWNFNGATNVTLNPGVYILKRDASGNQGGWNVNGGNWTGSGVTFYFADDSTIQFNAGMSLTLSPPTTGPTANIMIYENDASTYTYRPTLIFDDNKGESFSGLIYLPLRDVTFNSTSNLTTPSITVVAFDVIFDVINWSLTPNPNWVISSGSSGSSSTMATLSQ
jgi:Flp pilus assembly protein TadG